MNSAQRAQEKEGRAKLARWDAFFAQERTLWDIAKTEYPPIRWLVKELLPQGTFCLLSGGSKIGKSWLALQLASAVSLGQPFLGNPAYPTDQGSVLLLSLQLSQRQLHNRMEAAAILADPRVSVLTQWTRGPEALEQVRYWNLQHPDCRLIIIDMLEQVRDREAQTENSYSENVREIAEWTKLAQELDVTILGLTHDRKMRSEDFVSNLLGSVGVSGSAGMIWSLKRSRGKADAILYATGWDIEELDLPLVFEEGRAWHLLDGSASEREQSQQRTAVLEVLQEAEEPMGPSDIAQILDKRPGAVRFLLSAMKKKGLVLNASYGKYIVNNTNTHTN